MEIILLDYYLLERFFVENKLLDVAEDTEEPYDDWTVHEFWDTEPDEWDIRTYWGGKLEAEYETERFLWIVEMSPEWEHELYFDFYRWQHAEYAQKFDQGEVFEQHKWFELII